jgi:hypothetical protein
MSIPATNFPLGSDRFDLIAEDRAITSAAAVRTRTHANRTGPNLNFG